MSSAAAEWELRSELWGREGYDVMVVMEVVVSYGVENGSVENGCSDSDGRRFSTRRM